MLINGKNRLACKTLVKELGSVITVEPIRGLPVEKDLIVDMEPFFAAYRAVKPYLINDEPPPQRERLQSPEERERFDHGTKCILCASCTTSCPVFWVNGAIWALRPSSRLTVSSLTPGTGARGSVSRPWARGAGYGGAAPLTTAPRPAPGKSP